MTAARPLWAGRAAAVLAIILLALNLRSAVAAISPIVALVNADVQLDGFGLGILGTLPPVAFATAGIIAPVVARRIGLESTMVLACVAMIIGPVVRALAPNYAVLLVGSAIVFAGMGFGNILLPPAVKKFFPDRIGSVTSGYATVMSIGTSLPPLIAAPVAAAAGWRISVGSWAALAVLALVPWIVVRLRAGRVAALEREQNFMPEPRAQLLGSMFRSPTAIAIALAFAVTAIGSYSAFAWLPELLIDRAQLTPAQAGAALALFAITGLPLALVAPILAARLRNVGIVIAVGGVLFVLGWLGLLLMPTVAPWLWVLLVGLGAVCFPLCLALIGLRTRGQDSAVALSGFVQAIGYGAAALGPLALGILHEMTHDWVTPLLFLVATSLVAFVPAVILRRRSFVDDEILATTRPRDGE
ncbi:MAG: MFS transporter [Rhodoglobus sp.]